MPLLMLSSAREGAAGFSSYSVPRKKFVECITEGQKRERWTRTLTRDCSTCP